METAIQRTTDLKSHAISVDGIETGVKGPDPTVISSTPLIPHSANRFVQFDQLGNRALLPPPGLPPRNASGAENLESAAISSTPPTPHPAHRLVRFDKAGRRFLAPPIYPPAEPYFARKRVLPKPAAGSSGISLGLSHESRLMHMLRCRACTTSHSDIEANHTAKHQVAEREEPKNTENKTSTASKAPYYGPLWQAEEDLVYNTRIPMSTF
ncbi:hypothetical protein GGR57DRAFT_36211 [Xylariaceae sp. FL1272]|nr:hypothetical protein GGR57DRAFT_36211 [Xylariaceae sp. FL1272]